MKIKRLIGKDGMPLIDLAAVVFFSVYYILPSVNGSFNRWLALFAGIGYFIYVFLKDRKVGVSYISILLAVTAVAFAFLILTDTKTISESASNRVLKVFFSKFSQYFFMYLPGLLLIRVLKTANKEQEKFLLVLIVALYAIVLYNTFTVILQDPDAVRHWEEFADSEDENIGNYYFVYSVPIVIVGISVCMARLKGFRKIICLGMIGVLLLGTYFVSNLKEVYIMLKRRLDLRLCSLILACILTILIHGILDYTIYWNQTALIFLIILGSSSIYFHKQ